MCRIPYLGHGFWHSAFCVILLSVWNTHETFKNRQADSERGGWGMRVIPSPWASLSPRLGPGNPPAGSTADNSFVQTACELGGTGQTNGKGGQAE